MAVALSALLGLVGPIPATHAADGGEGVAFCDVDPDAWYGAPVAWAKAAGITTGVTDLAFDPTGTTTRGQIITMLYRYVAWRDGTVPPSAPHGFVDVDPAAYYAPAVGWAAANDITEGVAPDRFGPEQDTTRAQLAALLFRLEDRGPVSSGEFDDVPDGAWFDAPVHWMWDEEITTGTAPRRFSPGAISTRAELVTFLWRLSGRPDPGAYEPAPCPRRFSVIADSVVWGTRIGAVMTGDSYEGWIGHIDAAGCRQAIFSGQTAVCGPTRIPSAVEAIQHAVATGVVGEVVIVHVGTNGPLDADAIDQIVAVTPNDAVLWLMTIRTPYGGQERENAAIRDAAARWSPSRDVRVLDWQALADSTPGLLDRDGVHLTAAGRIAMRDLIGSALAAG